MRKPYSKRHCFSSALKYFTTLYDGGEPASQAWKALLPEQRKVYEDELVKKKQAYIVDFENFLKSLTKEELEAFSNSRRRTKKESEDDDDEEVVNSLFLNMTKQKQKR